MSDRCLLYYITDRSQFRGDEADRRHALSGKIIDAARAGVDYVQLREKDLSAKELEMLAREALAGVRENSASTQLLLNSRADVALAVGADGVHLRSDDLSAREVRSVVQLSAAVSRSTARFLVVASCHTNEEVIGAESEGADLAVFAPVFGKRGAFGMPPAGLAALRLACGSQLPVIALGGVTIGNAASCLDAGAAGIAGIRLFQENEIEDVVRALRAL